MKAALTSLALLLAAPAAAAIRDAVWRDGPCARDVLVRIYLPAGKAKAPAVIGSPGLGDTRGNASC